jgi:hypothetical protein
MRMLLILHIVQELLALFQDLGRGGALYTGDLLLDRRGVLVLLPRIVSS